MPNRKAVPADLADKFFQGESMFFGDPPQAPPLPAVTESPTLPSLPVQPPPPTAPAATQASHPAKKVTLPSVRQDVMIDVTTSLLQDIDLKDWREQIENTETQNSSLRLTSEERYVIEDVISDLQRKEKVKTSMNEIARLGLLFLIHEFKKHRRKSIIYRVKKA